MPVVTTAVKASMTPFYVIRSDISGQAIPWSGYVHSEGRRTLPMSTEIAQVESPVGTFRAVVDDGVVKKATFLKASGEERDRFGVHDALAAYFSGDVDALDRVTAAPDGTAFQREVWKRLREIKAGETWSYGDLARRVGNPAAARAVGMANASNPIA